MNANRIRNGLTSVEHSLIASKLGILFTLKTREYVSFKHEHVELDISQISVLKDIIYQHFNAEMTNELHNLMIKRPLEEKQIPAPLPHSPSLPKESWVKKVKGFFKIKSGKLQGEVV